MRLQSSVASMDYTLNTTSHYGSSAVTGKSEGRLSVVNQQSSTIGAGWSVAGVARLHARAEGGGKCR